METAKLSVDTKETLQFLADSGVLSKTNPSKFQRNRVGNTIDIFYKAGSYHCSFLTIALPNTVSDRSVLKNSTDAIQFTNAADLYTPFLFPILKFDVVKNTTPKKRRKTFASPAIVFSYGVERKILAEIFSKGKLLLARAGISESLLPQFLALTSSRITEDSGHGYPRALTIQGKARFTTVQILKYLRHTDDVEEIIRMWHTGVLPDDYESFKDAFQDAPEEWIEAIFSENVKNYWPANIPNA